MNTQRPLTEEELARLASLGYAGLGTIDPSSSIWDPKDYVPILEGLKPAMELKQQGRYEEALTIAQEVAAQLKGVDIPVLILAELYTRLGRRQDAITVLANYAREHSSLEVLLGLARLYFEDQQYNEMENALQAVELRDPTRGSVPLIRGDRFYAEGRFDDAVRQYRRAIEIDGERVGPNVHDKLWKALQQTEQHDN
jgi:tetratricopeptide (TPR) repeat protein